MMIYVVEAVSFVFIYTCSYIDVQNVIIIAGIVNYLVRTAIK